MLWVLLCFFSVMLIVLVIWTATRPDAFQVTRTATIVAPPEAVFPWVNELRRWESWSPWAKRDPQMQLTYEGPSAGKGAAYAWKGNRNVGEGRLTIMESRPHELIQIRLEFLKPIKATNMAEFRFAAENGRTQVTWSMTGKNSFVGKAIGLLMDMDKMIGGDFEAGLASIRNAAQSNIG